MIHFRQLKSGDAPAYRELRHEALQNDPDAFASEYSIEKAYTVPDYEKQLEQTDTLTLGAFDQERLVGMATLVKETLPKMRHRATLQSVYVTRAYRGRKISRLMIEELENRARGEGVVKKFYLYVMVTNQPATQAYQKMGFEIYGRDREAMKEGDRYVDEYLMAKFI